MVTWEATALPLGDTRKEGYLNFTTNPSDVDGHMVFHHLKGQTCSAILFRIASFFSWGRPESITSPGEVRSGGRRARKKDNPRPN